MYLIKCELLKNVNEDEKMKLISIKWAEVQ